MTSRGFQYSFFCICLLPKLLYRLKQPFFNFQNAALQSPPVWAQLCQDGRPTILCSILYNIPVSPCLSFPSRYFSAFSMYLSKVPVFLIHSETLNTNVCKLASLLDLPTVNIASNQHTINTLFSTISHKIKCLLF